MSEVITYKNDEFACFCQIKLDSDERILISIASAPTPSIKIMELDLEGIAPTKTIWEFSPIMAGGYAAYIEKMIKMFVDSELEANDEIKQPLDAIRDKLLPCHSVKEVLHALIDAERNMRLNEIDE